MREVELVEDEDPRSAGPREPASERPGRRATLRWRRWYAVPVVALAVVVGAQQGVNAYQRHVDHRRAASFGVLVRIEPPLRTVWTSTSEALSSFSTIGDDAISAEVSDGAVHAEAVDLRTGKAVWRTPLSESADDVGQCRPVTVGAGVTPTHVACLTSKSSIAPSDPRTRPDHGQLTVLDAGTGHLVTQCATPAAD